MTRLVTIFLLLIAAPFAHAQAKRRVFVLHSGMHIILAPRDKNQAATTLKEEFAKRGVPERDLIAMDCPFPTATFKDMVPREGLLIYLGSADPASRVSHEGYIRLHKTLQAAGVTKEDDVVWIGHSAGGQIGMTMAHLGHNLDKFPDLAKQTRAYRFNTVITLGAAIGSNPAPPQVKLRHYCSPADSMIYFLSKESAVVADSIQSKVKLRICCEVGPNVKLRVFPGVGHGNWYADARVLDCVLREFESPCRPAWRKTQADAPAGIGLGQLMADALEAEFRISLEEDRH